MYFKDIISAIERDDKKNGVIDSPTYIKKVIK